MLLNKTCFYSGLLHAYAAVEHANAVLEHSSGFQSDKIFLFISEAFPTRFLSVWKHFILILSKSLAF